MFKFLPSRNPSVIALEIDGKATGEDAQKLGQYVKENFGEHKNFHVFAIIQGLDGATWKGLIEGPKFDAKHWNQFKKFAIVSEKKWVESAVKVGDYLPGVTTAHFDKDQVDKAWDWLK